MLNDFRYGCKHESQARQQYEQTMCKHHENFTVCDSGLRINPKWPFMGATPDGITQCNCCGLGAVEIKVMFCMDLKFRFDFIHFIHAVALFFTFSALTVSRTKKILKRMPKMSSDFVWYKTKREQYN